MYGLSLHIDVIMLSVLNSFCKGYLDHKMKERFDSYGLNFRLNNDEELVREFRDVYYDSFVNFVANSHDDGGSDFTEYVAMEEFFTTPDHLCHALNWVIKVQKRELGMNAECVFPFREMDENFSMEDVARQYLYWFCVLEYEIEPLVRKMIEGKRKWGSVSEFFKHQEIVKGLKEVENLQALL